MRIDARNIHFKDLNKQIRQAEDNEITIDFCNGQRYIGSGLGSKHLVLNGTPGNALGAYLDGGRITVHGNTQDATGDTMNGGAIHIHGSSGDTTGYAMRGGKIYVKGNTGYRAGIHMKAYQNQVPVLIVGGSAGSFLGEYQAGGIIIVLGMNSGQKTPVGYFCGTGMHGGKIFLRCKELPPSMPPQVVVTQANRQDLDGIEPYLAEYCEIFGWNLELVCGEPFYMLTPNTKNPYKQLYTHS